MFNLSTKLLKTLSLAAIVMTALPISACGGENRQTDRGHSRIAPPARLDCDHNHLTSYNGQVAEYHRSEDSITITIDTDWDTEETVSLEFTEKDSPAAHFLMNGKEFIKDDWLKVEVEPGVLVTGMYAFVWVCLDEETPPVIDWRPHR